MRAKRILTSQRGFGLTEVVVSAGVLSVIALGMATLTDTVSRSQRTSRTIASRDDLKSSVDRFSKNYSALKNSALNPAVTDPGNLKFSNCMGTPRGGPPCDFAETPFVLLGPLVGSGAWPQSTTPYSGNFDTNGAPCAVAGPNCPIIVRTTFTCVDPCPAGNQVFQINYTIDGATGSQIPIRHIDTVGRVFEATGPLIQNANPTGGTANTLARWDSSGNSIGSSQTFEDVSGNVGIGTTTPGTLNGVPFATFGFHMAKQYMALDYGGGGYNGLVLNDRTQPADSHLWSLLTNSSVLTMGPMNDDGNPVPLRSLAMTRNGNVGIGTTTPGTLNGVPFATFGFHMAKQYMALDYGGGGYNGLVLNDRTQPADSHLWSLLTNSSVLTMGPMNDDGNPVPSRSLAMTRNGNVGIGTSTPSENLHIFGNGNDFLKIESTNDSQGAGIFLKGGTSSMTWEIATQQNYASNALVFSTTPLNSANNKMSILPNGNVGIGTEGPQTKLDVAGGIRPGTATVGTACSPEGTLSYDPTLHAPLYCNNSGQWAASSSMGSIYTASCFSIACTASCNLGPNDVVLGGGFSCNTAGSFSLAPIAAPTADGKGWTCSFEFSCTCYARCMRQ